MNAPDPRLSRLETVLGAVLYLMTAYRRTRCPRIAACVAAHLDCLAAHPHADATIREVCAGVCDEWRGAAGATPAPNRNRH
jgi:hypothetical protein